MPKEIITIKEKYSSLESFSDKAVGDLAACLHRALTFTTNPVMFDDMALEDYKVTVYSYVLYKLKCYIKNCKHEVSTKRHCIYHFCQFFAEEEQNQNKLKLKEVNENNAIADIQFSLLYYTSLGLINPQVRKFNCSKLLTTDINLIDYDKEEEIQAAIDSVWPLLQNIISSLSFRNAVRLFSFISTGSEKEEETLKLASNIKKTDILWISETYIAGLTTLGGKICIGYKHFKDRASKEKVGYLLYILIHGIGHYLLNKLNPNHRWTSDFSLSIKTILKNQYLLLSEMERELLRQADVGELEGGLAFLLLLYGSEKANYFFSESCLQKFIDPTSYKKLASL